MKACTHHAVRIPAQTTAHHCNGGACRIMCRLTANPYRVPQENSPLYADTDEATAHARSTTRAERHEISMVPLLIVVRNGRGTRGLIFGRFEFARQPADASNTSVEYKKPESAERTKLQDADPSKTTAAVARDRRAVPSLHPPVTLERSVELFRAIHLLPIYPCCS